MKKWLAIAVCISLGACECKEVNCDDYAKVSFNFVLLDDKLNVVEMPPEFVDSGNGSGHPTYTRATYQSEGMFYTMTLSPPDEEYFVAYKGMHATIKFTFANYRTSCCGYPYKVSTQSSNGQPLKRSERFKSQEVYVITVY